MLVLDPLILDTLTLNVRIQNDDFATLGKGLVLMYKIYYKLMTTNLSPKALQQSPIGETLMLEANIQISDITLPELV